ncbi:MAG: CPBP family intramembrane metalloprotease [Bacteroides sp.]|nr:CPBP family intramembrane metalloprotease [Eubacterium sp.]MCM1419361.1 CPBP family intramembrane metalloprotease [Roseburia sp.]MCM1463011.1 CPBP family intramembrane metalloprotease [Bacteroides sp.]
MKKFYEKNELWFAIVWIIVYVVVCGTVRGNFGDDSPAMLVVLALFSAGIIAFVKQNHLEEKYGLCKWAGSAKDYLFFIPPLVLMTGNLWAGVGPVYGGIGQIFASVSLFLVGFVEEMIFRGFLFRILLKKDPAPVAILISALTFGIGHIVNLLTGHATLETILQVLYAVALGYLFTVLFYKSGSLVVCIVVHGLIDVFSTFNAPAANESAALIVNIYIVAVFIVSIAYCLYLAKKPTALIKDA